MDYYVRTKQGEYRDSRHAFSGKWTKVPAGELRAAHFDNPKLEIVTAEDHERRRTKIGAAEPATEQE